MLALQSIPLSVLFYKDSDKPKSNEFVNLFATVASIHRFNYECSETFSNFSLKTQEIWKTLFIKIAIFILLCLCMSVSNISPAIVLMLEIAIGSSIIYRLFEIADYDPSDSYKSAYNAYSALNKNSYKKFLYWSQQHYYHMT